MRWLAAKGCTHALFPTIAAVALQLPRRDICRARLAELELDRALAGFGFYGFVDAYNAAKRRERAAAVAGLCVLLGVVAVAVASSDRSSSSSSSRGKDE